MRIAGVDLSLASTGVATMDADRVITLKRIRSEPEKVKGGPSLVQRGARHRRIVQAILDRVCPFWSLGGLGADLVVLEGPSYGSTGQGTWDRAGLWWHLVGNLQHRGIPVLIVPPHNVRKYGYGSAATSGPNKVDKDMVLSAVTRRYHWLPVDGNDVADALLLMAIGARLLGAPIEDTLPAAHLAALNALALPTEEGTLI